MPSSIPDQNPAHSPPEIPSVPNPAPEIAPAPSPQPEISPPSDDPGMPIEPQGPEIIPDSSPPEIEPPMG